MLVAGLGTLVLAHPLAGQLPSDTVSPIPVDSVIVEVLRTPVRLGAIPYPVSLLQEGALQTGKTGAFLEELLQGAPGVEVQNRYNFAVGERLSVRGFGARAQFGVRGVEVVVDGIPATLADGQSTLDHLDLASVGRVEILRGPASALYGNSAGGVLHFQTRSPPFERFREEVDVMAGSDGLRRYQSVTSGREGNHGYLLSLTRLTWDGFRTNPLDPDGDNYGQASRHHLNATYSNVIRGGPLRVTLNAVGLDAENPGSLPASLLDGDARPAWERNVVQQTEKDLRQAQVGLTWGRSISGIRTQVATWGILRNLDNPIPPAIVKLDRQAGGARIQVRGGSLYERAYWSLGVEWERQSDDRRNFENDEGRRGALTLDQEEVVTATGLFGQLSYRMRPRLNVTGGLRYDRIDFKANDELFGRPGAGPDPDDSGERTLDALSPSVALHFQATPLLAIFASASSVFQTPTTTEFANRPDGAGGFNPELEPERGVSVEAGIRGRTGRGLEYEATAYRTALNDELVSFEVPDAPGRSFFRNAGESDRTGMEVVLFSPLGDRVAARIGYDWVKATFDEFRVGDDDFAGNLVPGVAPHRLEGLVTASWGRLFLRLRGEWTDEIPVNDANTASAPSYGLVDLRVGALNVAAGSASLEPYAGITNLLDEDYVAAVAVNAFGSRYFEPGPGRSFYLGLSATF